VSNWLADALKQMPLTEEVEGYALGRGAKESSVQAEGLVTWRPLDEPAPDEEFRKFYGPLGEKIAGFLVCPVRSPRGRVIGFEGRNIHRKQITDFRLPEAKWNPFFIGTRAAMPALWAGHDVWVVEGIFDKFPLEWAVPEGDAVLATVRAHLGREHVEFFRRFCRGWVHMVYDRDPTGCKATNGHVDDTGKRRPGALELLRRVGLQCRDVPYMGGKDPGEIWDSGGAEAIRRAFG